jgi:hypothetical protein
MPKRIAVALLWFAATWFGYEVLWSVTGAPRLIGPVVAFVVSALVTIDPMALFWPHDVDPAPLHLESVEQTPV